MKFINISLLILVLIFGIGCQDQKSGVKVLPSGVELSGEASPEDEKFFNQVFNNLAEQIEKENLKRVLAFFSNNYADFSNSSKNQLRKNLKLMFENYEDIKMQISNVKIQVEGNSAASTYDCKFSAKKGSKKVKKNIKEYTKERLLWEKNNGKWQIVDSLTITKLKK